MSAPIFGRSRWTSMSVFMLQRWVEAVLPREHSFSSAIPSGLTAARDGRHTHTELTAAAAVIYIFKSWNISLTRLFTWQHPGWCSLRRWSVERGSSSEDPAARKGSDSVCFSILISLTALFVAATGTLPTSQTSNSSLLSLVNVHERHVLLLNQVTGAVLSWLAHPFVRHYFTIE